VRRSREVRVGALYVEYAERGKEHGILFTLILFCEYMDLEYVRIHVIYRLKVLCSYN